MNDDFKRPLGSVVKKQEDQWPPVSQTDPVQAPTVRPVVDTQPKKARKAPIVAYSLLVLALIASGVLGYLWYDQRGRTATAESDKASAQAELASLKAEQSKQNLTVPVETTAPDAAAFNKQYSNIMNAPTPANLDVVSVKKEILSFLLDYYKVDSLPSGWAVLNVYLETKDSEDTQALVYYPATDNKPAAFIALSKKKGSTEWSLSTGTSDTNSQ